MKNMVARMNKKTALRILLAGLILLALAISSIGIYFSTRKTEEPEFLVNSIGFATDKWDGTSASETKWESGKNFGKRGENSYTINSADSFIYFTQLVEAGNTFDGFTVYLNKNIDLNNHEISSLKNFQGTFDGAYYGIYNANIQGNGLFENTNGATIQNLGLYNCDIAGTGTTGGIVGSAINTKIYNCFVRLGKITGSTVAAGIVGNAKAVEISNTFADTTISAEQTAGLVGTAEGLKISHSYHTAARTYITATEVNLVETNNAKNINFGTWDYQKEYTLAKTWCNSSVKDLSFNYPILTRFNKVFLTGSCYENVVIKDGVPTNVETIRAAFETIGAEEEGEVNIIVEKVFMEETAVATPGALTKLTTSINTTLERGKTNAEALVMGAPNSSLIIGDLETTAATKTIVFDGQREYFEENNIKTDAAIVSTGYDFYTCSNVMVKNNKNSKTGYGGGISLIFPYKETYASTDEISAVGIDGTIVMNCESTLDGGGIYIGGTLASFKCGFALNVSNCKAGRNGGGVAFDVSYNSISQKEASALNTKFGYDKIISATALVDTRGRIEFTADKAYTFCNGTYEYDISESTGNDDVPDGGLDGCSVPGDGGGAWISANNYDIHLGSGTQLTVNNCKAGEDGGGVHVINACDLINVRSAALYLDNLKITSSEAGHGKSNDDAWSGGGLYADECNVRCESGDTLTLESNKCRGYGGGIYVEDSMVYIYSPSTFSCSGNWARFGGGGAAFSGCGDNEEVTFGLKGITITGNSTDVDGAGLYISSCRNYESRDMKVSWGMDSVTLTSNTATNGSGGGLYITGSAYELDMTSCTINSNTCGGSGGGILANQNIMIDGGEIKSNSANGNGGGICVNSGTTRLKRYQNSAQPYIGDNHALDGGAIYIASGATCNLDNVKIEHNWEKATDTVHPEISVFGTAVLSSATTIYGRSSDFGATYETTNYDIYLSATGALQYGSDTKPDDEFWIYVEYVNGTLNNRTVMTGSSADILKSLLTNSKVVVKNPNVSNITCIVVPGETQSSIVLKTIHKVTFPTTLATRTSSPSDEYEIYVIDGTNIYKSYEDDHKINYQIEDRYGTTHTISYEALKDELDSSYYTTYLYNSDMIVSPMAVTGNWPLATEYKYKEYALNVIPVLKGQTTKDEACGSATCSITEMDATGRFVLNKTEKTLSILNKTGGSSGTASATENNGYEFVGWKVQGTTNTGTYSPLQVVNGAYARWSIYTINVYAEFDVISYELDFYFDYNADQNYTNDAGSPISQTFNIEDGGDVPENLSENAEGDAFGGWVADLRDWEDGTHTYTYETGKTPIEYTWTVAGDKLTISNEANSNDANKVKIILNIMTTSVAKVYRITSIAAGSYGKLLQNPEKPILHSIWENKYKVVAHMGESYWNTTLYQLDDTKVEITYTDDSKAVVANKVNPFYITGTTNQSSTYYAPELDLRANAFSNELTRSKQVVSMGQEIFGWKVSVESAGKIYYVVLNDETGGTLEETATNIGSRSLKDVAQFLDHQFLGSVDTIHITPHWTNISINVTANYNDKTYTLSNASGVNFGEPYNLENFKSGGIGISELGKKVSHFEDSNGNPVAITAAKWNYTALNYSGSNGNYSIVLTPIFTDNLYKVNLTGVMPTAKNSNIYKLVDGAYEFSTYASDNYATEITYSDLDYINDLRNAINIKNDSADVYAKAIQIAASDFDISTNSNTNKVFTNISSDGTTATNGTDVENPTFFIYIKNEQKINAKGVLPIFDNDVYELDYWKNKYNLNKVYSTYINENGSLLTTEKNIYSQNEWKLEHGYSTNKYAELTISDGDGWFRKSFNVSVDTICEDKLGQYGYGVISVHDTYGADGNLSIYLVVYMGGMKIYSITPEQLRALESNGLQSFTLPSQETPIRIFAGSTVKIEAYDQQEDNNVYDEMVGYKFKNIYSSTLEMVRTDRVVELSVQDILSANLDHNEIFDIDLNFERIEYTMTIQMSEQDVTIGAFTLTQNSKRSESSYTKTTIVVKVGDTLNVQFNASIGYEMQENAFDLSNGKVLVTGKIVQTCDIDFTGAWLRANYYEYANTPNNPTYTHNDTTLPALNINTQKIDFTWNVQIVDTTNISQMTLETREEVIKNWKIGDSLDEICSEFENNTNIGSYVIVVNGKNYAAMSSYALKASGNLTDSTLLKTSYVFKLNSVTVAKEVSSINIYNMVGGEKGIIVPANRRVLTMVIDVREICAIELEIQSEDPTKEPNAHRELILNSAENAVAKINSDDGVLNTIAYTYLGADNELESKYDEKYAGVKYYVDGKELAETTFMVNKASDWSKIVAKYTARYIDEVDVIYTLNGDEVEIEELNGIFESVEFVGIDNLEQYPLYLGSEIEIKNAKWNKEAYLLDIYVNGLKQTSEAGTYTYAVQMRDFSFDKLTIEVALEIKPAGVVIDFAVREGKAKETDYYGDVYLRSGGIDTAAGIGTDLTANIGDKILVELAKGYVYRGYNKDSLPTEYINESNVSGEVLISITSSGKYTIVLDKENINVKLELEEGQTDSYKVEGETGETNTARTEVSDTYLESEIRLIVEENKREQYNYFYYLNGEDEIKLSNTKDAKFRLTSNMLKAAEYVEGEYVLTIKVNTTPKYKLEVQGLTEIVGISATIGAGEDKEEDVLFESDGSTRYHVAGTEIEVEIYTAKEAEEGKYSLILKDKTGNILNTNYDRATTKVTLTEDIELTLEIRANVQGVEVEEYLTSSLGDKTEVTADRVNGLEVENNTYNSKTAKARITYKVMTEDGEVERFLEVIKVYAEGELVAEYKLSDKGEIESANIQNGFKLEIKGEKAEISYTATSELKLTLEYVSMKTISQG